MPSIPRPLSPRRLPAATENAYRKFLGGGIADLMPWPSDVIYEGRHLGVPTGRAAERTTWRHLGEFLLEYD
ncbi:MAG: hypothetical protein LC713_06380 [Actinobacteria bacterium]|nr:hypothetical protein [Actinomycetota bacterium]